MSNSTFIYNVNKDVELPIEKKKEINIHQQPQTFTV